MSIAAHHAEWLALMDVSGPFLSVGVLSDALPNGLDSHDPLIAQELKAAHDAWVDPEAAGYSSDQVHGAFIRFVLMRVLGFDSIKLKSDTETIARFAIKAADHDVSLAPSIAVLDGDQPLMLIAVLDRTQDPDQPVFGDVWAATPRERMAEQLRGTQCALGMVTNGERWCLVSSQPGQVPGFATWLASLWREERITLQSFRTLLGARRFFSAAEDEQLISLLDRSTQDQSEVTTKLGNQTLEAVEILIRTIDRLDHDRGGNLLANVDESELYDAAVTVMMRLIFLFFAEENDLLPMEEPLYVGQYAASSLRARLQEEADRAGEEVLETTADAWPRLLATWRAVFAGVEHGDMRLAPYGGSLFDPDRYPFLEGRLPDTSWREIGADPLPIDNRTVLHLLNALQTLQERGQRHRLSFRALDVEQIGHVYEGMLDHTATRATEWVLGLSGTGGFEPEIAFSELEALDENALVAFLKEATGRAPATIRSWLASDPDQAVASNFANSWGPAFAGDRDASERVKRFAKFIRPDSTGGPTVFHAGSVYVCDSSHRGATGTHYTPRSLTVEIVADTLDPLVYDGPSTGLERTEWKLVSAEQILALKICDPACGSGAFLVQACRYLAEKLVETRKSSQSADAGKELVIEARREVAGRCLYGVDRNPMAVEMAKLSLWLVTLSRDKPFSFIDHAVRVGDSLVGLADVNELRTWNLGVAGEEREVQQEIATAELHDAIRIRARLEELPALDSSDIAIKAELLHQARIKTQRLLVLADLLIAPALSGAPPDGVTELKDEAWIAASRLDPDGPALPQRFRTLLGTIRPLHWPLEFPEVFEHGGFDAIVGNPPFMGGQRLTGELGQPYREYLVRYLANGKRGSSDLVAYFFLRSFELVKSGGNFGLLGVNTISEGDTRQVGLEQLLNLGATIYSAHPNEPWPNAAAVITSRVHAHKGKWSGRLTIDGMEVPRISAFLTSRDDWSPAKLAVNHKISFQGSILLGSGFIIEHTVAAALLKEDPANEDVIFPYLNGQDLNQEVDQKATRSVICFWDWPEKKAQQYAAPYEIVKRLVKPQRQERKADGTFKQRGQLPHKWWIFAEKRPALYHALGRGHAFADHPRDWDPRLPKLKHVIATSSVSKYWAPSLIPNDAIYSHALFIFASDSIELYCLLLSCVHAEWAWKQSSKMKRDLRYTPSDCFETFPLPESDGLPNDAGLAALGREFHDLRAGAMLGENIGLTDLYNRYHDPTDDTVCVHELRRMQCLIDHAVLSLYGWTDVELAHAFRDVDYLPENDRRRFAISDTARFEILDRLGALNRQRLEEEQKAADNVAEDKPVKRRGKELTVTTAKKGKNRGVNTGSKDNADLFDPASGRS